MTDGVIGILAVIRQTFLKLLKLNFKLCTLNLVQVVL